MEEKNSTNHTTYPKDTADLLARIERDWSAMMVLVEDLSREQLESPIAGGWAVKDHLAHLATWERFMLYCYLGGMTPHEAFGFDEATYDTLDEDGINALIYVRNADLPVEAVLADSIRTHQEVLAALQGMNFADLMKPRFADDPQQRPMLDWVIGNTYEHYQEHLLMMEVLSAGEDRPA